MKGLSNDASRAFSFNTLGTLFLAITLHSMNSTVL